MGGVLFGRDRPPCLSGVSFVLQMDYNREGVPYRATSNEREYLFNDPHETVEAAFSRAFPLCFRIYTSNTATAAGVTPEMRLA